MAPKDYFFGGSLADADPYLSHLTAVEAERQMRKLILIASESLCPAPVREALGSEFVNLYAEGYPSTRMSKKERDRIEDTARGLAFFRRYGDRRYYKGTEICDLVESLAETRVAKLFATDRVPADAIFANVQPLSGAAANNAVYEAFADPGDTVMGMALPHGGHLTHGSEFNRSGKTYRIVPYTADPKSGCLDYDRIMDLARQHRPKMIIVGFSAATTLQQAQGFAAEQGAAQGIVEVRAHRANSFIMVVDNPANGRVYQVSQFLSGLDGVEFAEPNHIIVPTREPRIPVLPGEAPTRGGGLGGTFGTTHNSPVTWTDLVTESFEGGALPAGWTTGLRR